MTSEAQKRATKKYKQQYQRRVVVNVNRRTEPGMLAFLEEQHGDNMQGFIKGLIRDAMRREGVV